MGGPPDGHGTDHSVSTGGLTKADGRGSYELEIGAMVGEYRVEGQLGSGGMGRVYAATHPVIAKRAAIKVLHPELSVNTEAVERFIQEARSVNQIGHPNIVDIFAFGELPDGRSYFVMEWLRGESLRDRLKKSMLPMSDALQILDTIAVALEAAHEKGIVHRDLKPDNIFLVDVKSAVPQVKLLDFGIAKLLGTDEHRTERTRTGNLLGTPAYISPEQARGHAVDHRTDIYALGALAYELMTGSLPFPSDNAADMIAKHLYEAPPHAAATNPQVTPELDALICAMLSKDVNGRPTLEQVRGQLRAYFGQFFVTSPMGGVSMRMTSEVGMQTGPSRIAPAMTPPPGALSMHAPIPGTYTQPGPIAAYQTAPSTPPAKSKTPLILLAALVAAGLGVGVFFAVRGGDKSDAAETSKPVDTNAAGTKPADTNAAGATKPADTNAAGATKPTDTNAAGANTAGATNTAGSNAAGSATAADTSAAGSATAVGSNAADTSAAGSNAADASKSTKKKPSKGTRPVIKKTGPKPADDDDAPM